MSIPLYSLLNINVDIWRLLNIINHEVWDEGFMVCDRLWCISHAQQIKARGWYRPSLAPPPLQWDTEATGLAFVLFVVLNIRVFLAYGVDCWLFVS